LASFIGDGDDDDDADDAAAAGATTVFDADTIADAGTTAADPLAPFTGSTVNDVDLLLFLFVHVTCLFVATEAISLYYLPPKETRTGFL